MVIVVLVSFHIHYYLRMVKINHIDEFREALVQLNKKDVEIVIASYGEELAWIAEFDRFTTIYEKKKDTNTSFPISSKRVMLPNIGREAHSYLYHIVHNYHNLANVTVFSQANRPSFGYKTSIPNQRDGGHFYCPYLLYDYLLARNGLFIFTEVMNITNRRHVGRNGYNNYWKQKRNKCTPRSEQNPFFKYPLPNSCFPLDYFESYTDHIGMMAFIAKECQELGDTTCSKITFWNKYIKLPLPPNDLVYYAQGGLFSVTKEQLHTRPLQDYKLLLDDFTSSKGQYMGILMEFFWFPLVTSQSTFCHEKYYNLNTVSERMQKTLKFLGEECLECKSFDISNFNSTS